METSDNALARVAAEQDGHFTRAQALIAGFSDKTIRQRIRTGSWVSVQRGVYRSATVPARISGEDAVAALCLPGGVVSHQSAARRLGFPRMGVRPVTVCVPRGTTHRLPGVVIHESSDMCEDDCILRDGVRLTSPVRTVIDLAAVLPELPLERLVDELLVAKVIEVGAVGQRLEALARRGKPGVKSLRAILEARGEGYVPPESELEARVIELLASAGLPAPERQASLPWRPGAPQRVDLLFRDQRVIIECDGRRWHTRERDFERDRRRRNEATLAGWRIIHITWNELQHHPGRIIAELRLLLGLAESAA